MPCCMSRAASPLFCAPRFDLPLQVPAESTDAFFTKYLPLSSANTHSFDLKRLSFQDVTVKGGTPPSRRPAPLATCRPGRRAISALRLNVELSTFQPSTSPTFQPANPPLPERLSMLAINPNSRCIFTSRDQRRCSMPRASDDSPFCAHHLRRWLKLQSFDPPSPRPLAAPGTLDNPWAVRRSLKQVVRDVVDGRLSPEAGRAAVDLARLLLIHTRRTPKRRTAKASRLKEVQRAPRLADGPLIQFLVVYYAPVVSGLWTGVRAHSGAPGSFLARIPAGRGDAISGMEGIYRRP